MSEPVYVIVAEDNYFVEIEDSNGSGVRVPCSRYEKRYRKFGPLYLAPPTIDADALSNFIRSIDGNNTMGAGALAEKIVEWVQK